MQTRIALFQENPMLLEAIVQNRPFVMERFNKIAAMSTEELIKEIASDLFLFLNCTPPDGPPWHNLDGRYWHPKGVFDSKKFHEYHDHMEKHYDEHWDNILPWLPEQISELNKQIENTDEPNELLEQKELFFSLCSTNIDLQNAENWK
jgi:hypothetical protein